MKSPVCLAVASFWSLPLSKCVLDLLGGEDKWVQGIEASCFSALNQLLQLRHMLTKPFTSAHVLDRSRTAYELHLGSIVCS